MIGRVATIVVCLALSAPALAQGHPRPAHDQKTKTAPALSKKKPKAVAMESRRSKPRANRPRKAKKLSRKRAKVAELRGPSARRGYAKVSDLVNFPSFFPGIGTLYV